MLKMRITKTTNQWSQVGFEALTFKKIKDPRHVYLINKFLSSNSLFHLSANSSLKTKDD